MKIAIDAMGGDYAPKVVIEGAKTALETYSQLKTLFLVGDENQLNPLINEFGLPQDRIQLVHTDEMVEMHESGAKMLRKKRNASISLAAELVKKGEADAVIGAGNTGAAVANATIKLRTLEGVTKAAIASCMPNNYGQCILMDAGANPDPRPENVVENAFMGAIYAAELMGISKPKVGIMSNGEEEEKGTDFTKAAHKRMKEIVASGKELPFEYVGYIEGRDIFLENIQVCLTDGFTGNIILKTAEGIAKAMGGWIKEGYKKTPLTMLAGLMSKGVFAKIKDRTNHEKAGGSLLLGVNGLCVIGHGSSSGFAIHNAIRLAIESLEKEMNSKIIEAMKILHSIEKVEE